MKQLTHDLQEQLSSHTLKNGAEKLGIDKRCLTNVLHAASVTPEPIGNLFQ